MELFMVGCNYWATHAGIDMWKNWDAELVGKDLQVLAQNGVKYLRVFPIWRDFQPVHILYKYENIEVEYRMGEKPLDWTEEGRAGIDPVMMDRFFEFCQLVESFGIKLIVGLVTGWMSGRLYTPPAIDGLNVMTSPKAQQWQMRFIKCFVKRFKNEKSIIAWDLGNECNCMSTVTASEEAYVWSAMVRNAIVAEDNTKPVVSGMHSLTANSLWSLQDQGEITDIVTTHPYPLFTEHAYTDFVGSFRSLLQGTIESTYYEDISGKPCLVEETGFSKMTCDNETGARLIRANLYSNWIHGFKGLLWWCSSELNKLENAPYDWSMGEREMGMMTNEREPKEMLLEMKKFSAFLQETNVKTLPKRKRDALCILSSGSDTWTTAYGAGLISKQAGIELEYTYPDRPIVQAFMYFLPSAKAPVMNKRRWEELKAFVRNGSTLYISFDYPRFSEFEEVSGIRIKTSARTCGRLAVVYNRQEIYLDTNMKYDVAVTSAQVIFSDKDGSPVLVKHSYGKGTVYTMFAPIENIAAKTHGIMQGAVSDYFSAIYSEVISPVAVNKVYVNKNKFIGITLHPTENENEMYLSAVNYYENTIYAPFQLKEGYKIIEVVCGNTHEIQSGGCTVIKIRR